MTRPRLELAEILRVHGETYRRTHPVSDQQDKVMTRIMKCRTAALGGHVEACGNCAFTSPNRTDFELRTRASRASISERRARNA
jgi:hypothetical protein